jgi:hypothetical protein
MSSFDQLEQAIPNSDGAAPLQADEVAFSEEQLADEAALRLVLHDVAHAEKYNSSHDLPNSWAYADDLYRALVPTRVWPGTNVNRAALSMPVVQEAIEKILPVIYLAFFSDRQPFLLLPTGKTTPEAARAKSKVLNWAIKQAGFKEEIRKTLKSTLLYGFSVGKWGWKTSYKTIKTYKRKEDGSVERKTEQIEINHPTFENVDLRNVIVDSKCAEQDIRKSRFVCGQVFITANDLDTLREDPCYKNIPTREELRQILSARTDSQDSLSTNKVDLFRSLQAEPRHTLTEGDPLVHPIELLEYVTDDRIVTLLAGVIIIRNEPNEFGRLNYVSSAFIDVPGSMHGIGIARHLSGEQLFQQGVINAWIDQLTLQLNPAYQLTKGIGPGTQQIKLSPGKVITEAGELKPLITESLSMEALNAVQTSEARAMRRVAANGGADMPTQALRTAEGVQAFSASIEGKLQYFIEIFSDLVYVPVLEAFIEMCNEHLEPDDINMILSEEDGKEYQGDIMDIYNCTCNVEVLSSTKLANRKSIAQLVPLLLQMVSAQPVQDSLSQQGKKFNYAELISEAVDLAGWDVDQLIVDMSPEDMQRMQMMNQAMVRAQSDQAKMQQKHANDLEDIQAQGEAKAGVQVIRSLLKQAEESGQGIPPEAIQSLGQPQQAPGINGQ